MIDQTIVNSENWALSFYQKYEAVYKTPNQYYPIDPIIIPIAFQSSNIVVQPFNPTVPSYWWLGAYLEVLINIPNIDTNVIAYNQNLKINNKTLIQLPTKVSYSLKFIVPTRMSEITLSIWEYIEP
ncbi:hypothetical protein [Okeania sp. KiyG1]|uniref:hypothetical protein n=1 Tax=Okeania sp. KiyG1 TaxID=2720165 RepID=UPI001924D513|nr:hypothetical protein [Okeania sp. KiyG1]GGA28904.1 hypothetical protein CYANOKiyG1_45230 [Okeania sp. KiyG1]